MKRPPWKMRRRVIVGCLLFCAAVVFWLAIFGPDTELNRSIANALVLLAGSVIGSYVFGATWDDANVMKSAGIEAYQDDAPAGDDHQAGFP